MNTIQQNFRYIKNGLRVMAFFFSVSLSLAQQPEVTTILKRYVTDYQQDISLKKDITFGIQIDDNFWHVNAIAKTKISEASVTLHFGKPTTPTFYFTTDQETLEAIDKGELNALTASVKAFSTDVTPFDADIMEGFQPDEDFLNTLLDVYFHFWSRGMPERIPFGLPHTRFTHGAQATVFYYQPGFRSGYFALKQGQHANADERSRTNPFPSLFIATKGEGEMIINGERSTMKEGEAIFIPPQVSHEFFNPNPVLFEGIILMFGEGA